MARVIQQIEFESVKGDVPVMFYDQAGPEHWLLVVGLMNVKFKAEQVPEVIHRLRQVLSMLEENE